jgi:putative membrane protein (TIGR04086 family)
MWEDFFMGKTKINIKNKKAENAVINTFIRIEIIGLLIYVVVFLLSALIAMSVGLKSNYYMIISLLMFSVCSFVTALTAGRKIRERGLLVGVIYTLPLNTLVLLLSLFYADFSVDYHFVVSAISLLLSGAVGGVVGVNLRFRR